jgi:hypothetical protein
VREAKDAGVKHFVWSTLPAHDEIALANKIAGKQPSKLSTWTQAQNAENTVSNPVPDPVS